MAHSPKSDFAPVTEAFDLEAVVKGLADDLAAVRAGQRRQHASGQRTGWARFACLRP